MSFLLKQLLLRNCAVDFVEICKVHVGKMIIKATIREYLILIRYTVVIVIWILASLFWNTVYNACNGRMATSIVHKLSYGWTFVIFSKKSRPYKSYIPRDSDPGFIIFSRFNIAGALQVRAEVIAMRKPLYIHTLWLWNDSKKPSHGIITEALPVLRRFALSECFQAFICIIRYQTLSPRVWQCLKKTWL